METRACSEGLAKLTASQSAPNGAYGPYDHITSTGSSHALRLIVRVNRKALYNIFRVCILELSV